ncbi:MAG TPA: hypothetical protein VEV44_09610 [Pseudoneobacillus sp.]|nr:hypothetical protein [Pseudoneobacillus sp.]
MKKTLLYFVIVCLLLVNITGCNQSKAEEDSRLSLIKTTNPSPVQINKGKGNVVEDIKKDVMKF